MTVSLSEAREQAKLQALQKIAEHTENGPQKANCLSAMLAAYNGSTSDARNALWAIDSTIEKAAQKIIKTQEKAVRDSWLETLSVGDKVEVKIGARKGRHSSNKYGGRWESATLTKIYDGKHKVTYTVSLDTPKVTWRRPHGSCKDQYRSWEREYVPRERKEQKVFKVALEELRKAQ